MEDRFSQVPGDILDLIFLGCDVKDTFSLLLVCKKFHSQIDTERMWKERSLTLWKKIVPFPTSELEWIKEKTELLPTWKRITKFLFNKNGQNYRYEWNQRLTVFHFKRYKGGVFIPSNSVQVSFHPRNKFIKYGECLGKRSGHGISHSPHGTYIGKWRGNSRHGQGKMTCLDGYQYDGKF
eukprot:TRINITY_DN2120_c0_g3_i3.p1 TRINITY_DN2120_c0_g3~~TRINITY_DN2120_c0_g3_i3.p1  ORF type:complete len:180 (-),score=32.12 TRINITY_DN2120_c0_g3_i3:268-807(-)